MKFINLPLFFCGWQAVLSSGILAAGNIVILPTPEFSMVYKTACLAGGLSELDYNVTVVLPGGPIKETITAEFDIDIIVSDGMTKSFYVLEDLAKDVVQSGFSGSQLGMLNVSKITELCYNIVNDEHVFKTLQGRKFQMAVISMGFVNLCASVIPYKLSIPFVREEIMSLELRNFIHPAVFPVNIFLPTTDKMTYLQRLGNTLFYFLFLVKPDLFNPSDVVRTFAPEKPHITNEELLSKADFFLLDYDELVDYHLSLYPDTIPVGGLSTRPPRKLTGELKEFMDSAHDGAVIVSLGSYVKWFPDNIVDTLIEVFRRLSNLKFVFKYGKETRVDGNVIFMPWIPQNDVLGHQNAKLFVSHCGHNAQYDAVYNAVPVVALPVYGDQHYNALKMQAKGYGLVVNIAEFTEDDMVSAINAVLQAPSYKQNILDASLIFKSRSFTPAQRAAWWIDHVIKYGGTHLHSPALNLPFYQFLLIDVIIGIVLISSFICIGCCLTCRCMLKPCLKRKLKVD